MIKPIFKSTYHQSLFNERGYVKLSFLSEDEVQSLENIFDESHPILPQIGFYSDSFHPDYRFKRELSDRILNILTNSLNNYFWDYRAIGGSFLFKMPGVQSELAAHQDWTIVDEENFVALNCWIPLCDTGFENGTLMVVPGSHYTNIKTLRAPTLPFFFTGNEDIILKNLVPLEVKKGEAIILNQSLIHYSPPNMSNSIRKALTVGILSRDADTRFYYKDSSQACIIGYSMPEDFLIRFDNFFNDISLPPSLGNPIETMPFLPPLSRHEVELTMLKCRS